MENLRSSNKIKQNFYAALFLSNMLFAQNFVSDVSKVGTTAASILDVPISARSLALGNAVSGNSNDASVLSWNPARVASFKGVSLSATYIPYFVDTQVQHAAITMQLAQKMVFGAYLTSWSMGDMPVRTELEQDGTGEYFNASDLVAAIVLARQLTDRYAIGFTVKYIQERIWHSVARGIALDFGTEYNTGAFGDTKITAVLTNYGVDMKMNGRDKNVVYDPDPSAEGNNGNIPAEYSTDWWALPLNFRFGLSSTIINQEKIKIIAEINALHPSNNYESIDMGLELIIVNSIFLRTGYSSFLQKDSIEGLSIGAGVIISYGLNNFSIDYGYRDYGHLGFLHAVTVNVSL